MGASSMTNHLAEGAAKIDLAAISSDDLSRDLIGSLVGAVSKLAPVDCPLVHRFSSGVYIRQITIPAGTCIVGKIHATKHFNIILSGHCFVIQSDGVKIDVNGAYTYESDAGVQKCVYALTDTIWQTIHVTKLTNLDEIEREIIAKDESDLQLKLRVGAS